MPGETYTATNKPGVYHCYTCDRLIEDWGTVYRFVVIAQEDPSRVYAVLCRKGCTQ